MQIEAKLSQLLSQAPTFGITAIQLQELLQAAFRRAFAQTFHIQEETLTVLVGGNQITVMHASTELILHTPDRDLVRAVRRF